LAKKIGFLTALGWWGLYEELLFELVKIDSYKLVIMATEIYQITIIEER